MHRNRCVESLAVSFASVFNERVLCELNKSDSNRRIYYNVAPTLFIKLITFDICFNLTPSVPSTRSHTKEAKTERKKREILPANEDGEEE